MRQHQAILSIEELRLIPAGDRGPRLRALIAFYEARVDGAAPRVRSRHLSRIRQAQAVARITRIAI